MLNQGLKLKARLESLEASAAGVWKLDACGVSRSETPILALIHRDAYVPAADSTRVLVVGGLSGRTDDVESALRTLELYIEAGGHLSREVALSAVPCGNPDGLALGVAPGNGVDGVPGAGYPPTGGYFDHAQDPETRYMWRWICFQGPDLVLEVRAGRSVSWEANDAAFPLAGSLGAATLRRADSLLAALAGERPSGLASIPGLRLTAPPDAIERELQRLWLALSGASTVRPSPVRRALDARRSRPPLQIARVLASAYGHTLAPVIYTQGVAISGRLRLAQLEPEGDDSVSEIVGLVEPCVSGGVEVFGEEAGTANLAGLVWGDELAKVTGDWRYADLVVSAADRYRPGATDEAPPPSDQDFRAEDTFMNGAMLGRAFTITGDGRYLDTLAKFLLNARVQQDDGLFWHCRSTPYRWGRGNGVRRAGVR